MGLISIEAHCHSALALYWCKLVAMDDSCLPKICFREQLIKPARFSWAILVKQIMEKYEIVMDTLPSYIYKEVKAMVKDKIHLYHMRRDLCDISSSPFSSWLPLYKLSFVLENYLTYLTVPPLHKAFTALCFQCTRTMVLEGRYKNIPYHLRSCICNSGEIEDIFHYLLKCPLYELPRAKYLSNIIALLQERSTSALISWLLADSDPDVTHKVAMFGLVAKKLRAKFLQS